MKFLMSPFVLLSSLLLLNGCSSLSQAVNDSEHRQVTVENSWVRSTLKHDNLGFRRLNRMTPLLIDRMLIQGNSFDGITAYDRKTGTEIWTLNIRNGVEGGAQAVADKLYFGAGDGQFYCVDRLKGKILWTFQARAETLSPPIIQDGVVYFESGAAVVYALDATSGKQLWLYNRQLTGNFSIRAATRPTVNGDSVFVGFSDGFVVALKKRDGSLLWERKIGKGNRFHDVDSTPVIDGPNLYVASFDGSLASLAVDSGNINWIIDEGGYVPVTLGTGRWSDRLYYATTNGLILILDKNSGKQLGSIKLENGIPTQPTLYKGYLLYGESDGAFVVADAATGKKVNEFYPGHGIMARPTVIEGTGEAFFISNSGNLYAMRLGYLRAADRLPWTAQ